MKRSDKRILTTHVGSLPRPDPLIEVNRAKFTGEGYDANIYAERLAAAVEEVCEHQAEIGVDIINDGEFGKTTSGPDRLWRMVELCLGAAERLGARRARPPPGTRRQAGSAEIRRVLPLVKLARRPAAGVHRADYLYLP